MSGSDRDIASAREQDAWEPGRDCVGGAASLRRFGTKLRDQTSAGPPGRRGSRLPSLLRHPLSGLELELDTAWPSPASLGTGLGDRGPSQRPATSHGDRPWALALGPVTRTGRAALGPHGQVPGQLHCLRQFQRSSLPSAAALEARVAASVWGRQSRGPRRLSSDKGSASLRRGGLGRCRAVVAPYSQPTLRAAPVRRAGLRRCSRPAARQRGRPGIPSGVRSLVSGGTDWASHRRRAQHQSGVSSGGQRITEPRRGRSARQRRRD